MKVGNLRHSAFRLPLDGKVYDKLTDGHIPLNGLLEVYIVHFSVKHIYKIRKIWPLGLSGLLLYQKCCESGVIGEMYYHATGCHPLLYRSVMKI